MRKPLLLCVAALVFAEPSIAAPSAGGASWEPSHMTNTSIAGLWAFDSDVYALVSESNGTGLFHYTLYRSFDSGGGWTASSGGLPAGALVTSLASDGAALYAGIFGFGVFRSVDRGSTWTPVGPGLPLAAPLFYALGAGHGLVVVAVLNQVFWSTDGGKSWSGPVPGLDDELLFTDVVVAGDAVYAGTNAGVLKSVDGGLSWKSTALGEFTRLVAVAGASVYGVTSSSGVFRSDDGGDSWKLTALARDDIYSLATFGTWIFAANVGNALGAGRKDDVFFSADGGETWSTVEEGLFLTGGVFLAASDRALFAGTRGFGVQALSLRPDRKAIEPGLQRATPRVVDRAP